MTKEKYLKDLKQYLKGIPEKDIEEAVSDIEEYFISGIENNRSEDSIASALLKPKALAYTIKAEYNISSISMKNSFSKTISVLLIIIGLGFMNMILLPLIFTITLFVLCIYFVLGCIYFTGGLLILAPILKMLNPAFVNIPIIPVILLPVIGLVVLRIAFKLHKNLNILTKKILSYILKYFKYNFTAVKK